jgi:hypothetical protein
MAVVMGLRGPRGEAERLREELTHGMGVQRPGSASA